MRADDTLGEWAYHLTPDFIGKMGNGKWGCLLTFRVPHTGEPLWAFGWADTAKDARDIAIANLVEQRFAWRVHELVTV